MENQEDNDSIEQEAQLIREKSSKKRKKKSKAFETIETIIIALVLAIFIRATVAEARYIPSESMVPTLLVKDRLVVEKISNYTGTPKRGDVLVFYPPENSQLGRLHGIDETADENTFVGKTLKWLGLTKNVAYIKRVIGLPGETIEIKGHFQVTDQTVELLKNSFEILDAQAIDKVSKLKGETFKGKDAFQKKLLETGLSESEAVIVTDYADRKGIVYIDGKALEEDYIKDYANYEFGPVKIPEANLFMLGDNRNNSADSHVWGTLPEENIIGHAILRFWPPQRIGTIH